jgi:glycosyltransferase involved in cell wall biosynthesis
MTSILEKNLNQLLSVEYIFVDDGSADNTLDELKKLKKQDDRVHFISFSRNFGKEAAMLAGLKEARGRYVVLLDVDLQHPPSLIPQMYEVLLEGKCDCVAARRNRKGDSPFLSFLVRRFYRVITSLTEMEMVDGVGDFRLMTRPYVDAVLSLEERNRFSKGIYPWIGFKLKLIEYENIKRTAGQTKWSLGKLLAYSVDGIISFSTKLLRLASFVGVLSFLVSLVLLVLLVLRKLAWGVQVDGWTTIVCLVVLFGGFVLLAIGVLGEYISKIYIEVKRRPSYIVKEKE